MPLDHTRDSIAFNKLLKELCATMDKPFSDALVDAWWKALKHCSYASIEMRVNAFLQKVKPETPFPRPSQMREPDDVPKTDNSGQDFHRGYWRSCLVYGISKEMNVSPLVLEAMIIGSKESLGEEILELLNEYCEKDHERTHSPMLHGLCIDDCRDVAYRFAHLKPVAA